MTVDSESNFPENPSRKNTQRNITPKIKTFNCNIEAEIQETSPTQYIKQKIKNSCFIESKKYLLCTQKGSCKS